VLGGAALFAAACGLQAARGFPLYPRSRIPFARSEDDILNCRRWAEAQGL
jgi:hypothetical protein